MKIALFGGTGRVGRAFLHFIEAGGRHSVSALVRAEHPNLPSTCCRTFRGNARNPEDTQALIKEADIVVSCLNTDGDDTLSVSIQNIINAMSAQNKKRLITIGTAGILQSRQNPALYRFESNESKRRSSRAAKEHANVYERLLASDLNWTVICPTYLPDGPAVTNYRVERNFLPIGGKEISTGDTAHFLYKQLDSDEFIRARAGLAY
ncbi:NAD(P)-dependent oxidoreductase [Bacillus sonorensis]|uniref:NAD(P)-dependent oxidoreductase n=1 Tax=Bacillus sonorensis TaxID=119858 RepID=UPI002280A108|nr:NAD(P)H-binding protein [Bacillus sonorensis]MCY7855897.1 NAD(P)H-binding protein [Bacillus sonorensis]MCY8271577.1 NAD(P)H-binding protein [Bacillus sonorensis]